MAFFDVFGPFDVQVQERAIARSQQNLWQVAELRAGGVPSAIGCYLFGVRLGKKITPWYVGMTVAQGGFAAEAFQPHKVGIYNEVLAQRAGTPVLFLFPLLTQTMRFSKAHASSRTTILWLERTLMGLAFGRNPEISNIRDMKLLRNVEVLGLLGPKRRGRPYHEAQEIRRVLLGR